MGQKGAEAHKAIAGEAEKSLVKHEEWHKIVNGLKAEFPELAHIAHFALNPITLAVAAIGGAFALWKGRMEEVTRLVGGIELPDISSDSIGHINAASEAWKKYGEALHKTAEQLASAQAQNDAIKTRLEQELALNLQLIQSVHEYAAAKLEAQKAAMSEAEYTKKKIELDSATGDATTKSKEGAARDAFAAKVGEVLDLRAAAEDKRGKAGGIRVASKEDDAQTLEKMTKMSEAAKKDLEEREESIGKFLEYKSGGGTYADSLWVKKQQLFTNLSVDEMIAHDRENAASDRQIIEHYRSYKGVLPGRDKQRKEREDLLTGAAADEAQAATIEAGLPQQKTAFRGQEDANRRGGKLSNLADLYKLLQQEQADQKRLQEEIAKSVQTTGGFAVASTKHLADLTTTIEWLKKRIESLESPSQRTNHL
jgi:hypothetical protein